MFLTPHHIRLAGTNKTACKLLFGVNRHEQKYSYFPRHAKLQASVHCHPGLLLSQTVSQAISWTPVQLSLKKCIKRPPPWPHDAPAEGRTTACAAAPADPSQAPMVTQKPTLSHAHTHASTVLMHSVWTWLNHSRPATLIRVTGASSRLPGGSSRTSTTDDIGEGSAIRSPAGGVPFSSSCRERGRCQMRETGWCCAARASLREIWRLPLVSGKPLTLPCWVLVCQPCHLLMTPALVTLKRNQQVTSIPPPRGGSGGVRHTLCLTPGLPVV